MDALVLWRQAALVKGAPQASSRAASPTPFSDEESALSGDESRPERPTLGRSSAGDGGQPKPSSSSWIRWWSRRTADSTASRPELKHGSSAPSELVCGNNCLVILPAETVNHKEKKTVERLQRGSEFPPPSRPVSSRLVAEPGPMPSKPDFTPMSPHVGKPVPPAQQHDGEGQHRTRYAKTLRLTSEQLV